MFPLLLFVAQNVAPEAKPKLALISGVVVNDVTGQPLRRARVSLIPRVSGLPDLAAETNDDGTFVASGIEPGQYGLQAVRDGFLPGNRPRRGPFRMPPIFNLASGEEIKDVTFRLEPWAAIDGKVKYFDDGEPAVGIPVYLFRKLYYRGRQMYTIAGRDRTNDRGYYRIHGIAPGTYTLSASYDKPVAKPKEDAPLEAPVREPSYASAYYPSGVRITDAMPVRLSSGLELNGLDMFLEKVESVRVSGTLKDGCTGGPASGATVEVLRQDAEGATVPANVEVRQSAGAFVIRGITPGTYILSATLQPTGPCPGRSENKIVLVSSEPIETNLFLANDLPVRFTITMDGKPLDLKSTEIKLQPKTPGRPILTVKSRSPRRGFPEAPMADLSVHELYNVFVERVPSADAYQLPPYTVGRTGFVEVRLQTDGGKLVGTVRDAKKKPVPGTIVTVIPESYTPQLFREGYVDQNGLFTVTGLAPGSYIAIPWMDNPPCDINNPNDIEVCRAFGKTVTVKAGESQLLELDLSIN